MIAREAYGNTTYMARDITNVVIHRNCVVVN